MSSSASSWMIKRRGFFHGRQILQYDFDAWLYHVGPPPTEFTLNPPFPLLAAAMEDIKFSFNAWNLVRVCQFFGCRIPTVIGPANATTPSLDISQRGNRLFHHSCTVSQPLLPASEAVRVGLTPHPTKGKSIEKIDFLALSEQRTKCIQLVVGNENGMSDEVAEQCDVCACIPQYGSIGSLSVINALSVAMHTVHTALRGRQLADESDKSNHSVNSSARLATSDIKSPDEMASLLLGLGHQRSELVVCEGPDAHNEGHLHPHGPAFNGLNDATVLHRLQLLRAEYPLQITLVWYNSIADRNIGATIRNANVYNCDKMIVLGRRKYSRRGTVGCQHYTPVVHAANIEEAESLALLDGMERWCLVNDFPYFCNRLYAERHGSKDDSHGKDDKKFMDSLCGHPVAERDTSSVRNLPRIYCDDEPSVLAALRELCVVKKRNSSFGRGIALFVPEEGCTIPSELHKTCSLELQVMNPRFLHSRQCGLPASLSTAIVLDKLRSLSQMCI